MGVGKITVVDHSRSSARSAIGETAGQSVLGSLLLELASVVLSQGVSSAGFNEIAKRAFFEVAASKSRFRNGRVNQSRVSVLTGLRRGEVRRLLRASHSPQCRMQHRPPLDNVVAGWCADRRFAHRNGTPKRLRIKGTNASFASLVRSYAGDIPPRAVLSELSLLGVTRQCGRFVEVQSLTPLRRRQHLLSMIQAMPAIVDGIRLAAHPDGRCGSSAMRRLVLPAQNLLDLEMIRARCIASAEAMLEGLKSSLVDHRGRANRRGRTRHSYSVTVLMVENTAASRHAKG